jgi:N-methylhydantoinase A
VGIHLVAFAAVGKLKPTKLSVTGRKAARAKKGQRKVDFALGGIYVSDIYDGDLLEPGMKFSGPGIIETAGTTVVIPPGNQVRVDDYGNVHIAVGQMGENNRGQTTKSQKQETQRAKRKLAKKEVSDASQT